MKKILMICAVCCMMLITGCGDGENKQHLNDIIGEWTTQEELTIGRNSYMEFKINSDKTFSIIHCLYSSSGSSYNCDIAKATVNGKYKLDGDNLTLNVTKEVNPPDEDGFTITMPDEKMVVDFDKMIICPRNEGKDCKMPFEKSD